MTKTGDLVSKIDLLTRNCNYDLSYERAVLDDVSLSLMWIILIVLCKVFETALFGNLKFIATCLR